MATCPRKLGEVTDPHLLQSPSELVDVEARALAEGPFVICTRTRTQRVDKGDYVKLVVGDERFWVLVTRHDRGFWLGRVTRATPAAFLRLGLASDGRMAFQRCHIADVMTAREAKLVAQLPPPLRRYAYGLTDSIKAEWPPREGPSARATTSHRPNRLDEVFPPGQDTPTFPAGEGETPATVASP